MKAHGYLILSSLKRIKENPRLHLLSIFTVAICFFLVGAGLMGFYHLKRSLSQAQNQQWVYVYVDHSLGKKEQKNFTEKYCKDTWVDKCRFVDQEKAASLFLSQYPDMKTSLETLGENPFPASVEIQLKQKIEDKSALQSWLAEIKKAPVVTEVDDGGKWLTQWIDLILFLDSMTYVLMVLVGLMIIGLISNTIQLLMFSKKDEIGILQLVGATPSMIRLPLLLNAAFYGLFGSLLSLCLLYLGYIQLNRYISSNFSALMTESLSFMSLFDQVLLVCIAVIVSILGAWLSVQRYLQARDVS